MFKQAAGQWVRIAVPINTVLGFFSDAKQFSDYLAHRAAKWDLRFAKNLLINQTTFQMLREVPQVEKWQKFPDPLVDFRAMATNIKG